MMPTATPPAKPDQGMRTMPTPPNATAAPREGGLRCLGQTRAGTRDTPLVSVITASYNRLKMLPGCLDSIIAQHYPREQIEILVIDGGSTDGTLEFLRRPENQERIDYWLSEPDGGAYDAMNKGWRLARGDLVVFLNTDDEFEPGAIADSVAAIQAAGADYAYADAIIVDHETGKQPIGRIHGDLDNLYFHTPYCHQTHVCKRSCFEELGGFDTSLRIYADYDFMWRLFAHGCRAVRLPQATVRYRAGGLSSAFAGQELLEVQRRQAQAYRHAFATIPGLCRDYQWKSLGKLAIALKQPEPGRQAYAAQFRQTYAELGLDEAGLRHQFAWPRHRLYAFLCSYATPPTPPLWILTLAARLLYYESRLRR